MIISEIGGNNNSRINLRVKGHHEENHSITSNTVLESYKPNRIRIRISRKRRILIFVNTELKSF